MALESLTLIVNPGSASRKYALYNGTSCLLRLHFEYEAGKVVVSAEDPRGRTRTRDAGISHITFASAKVPGLISDLAGEETLSKVRTLALRIVAPSKYFQEDHILNTEAMRHLEELEPLAPLHVNATLQEAHQLKNNFPDAKLAGISDSRFHKEMPPTSRYYGMPIKDQERFGIIRYGYHGLSCESVVSQLRQFKILPKRLIICHLGSGASVTAAINGKSLNTTMGFSPLEGLVMATRSGSLDITAADALRNKLKLDKAQLQDYLNNHSGLAGLSGTTSDIRELLEEEPHRAAAGLALDIYVGRICEAIGSMSADLGGLDALIFTGTVGERSSVIRQRIIRRLLFLGLELDARANRQKFTRRPLIISREDAPVKIFIVPADEDMMMARRAAILSRSG